MRKGRVDRVANERTLIIKEFFQKKTDMSKFINMTIKLTKYPEFSGKIV